MFVCKIVNVYELRVKFAKLSDDPKQIMFELVPVVASPSELTARASRQPMCDELDLVPLKTSLAHAATCVFRWPVLLSLSVHPKTVCERVTANLKILVFGAATIFGVRAQATLQVFVDAK